MDKMDKLFKLTPKNKKTLMNGLGVVFAAVVLYVIIRMVNSNKMNINNTDLMSTGRNLPGLDSNFSDPAKLDKEVQEAASAAAAKPSSGSMMDPMQSFAPVSGMQGTVTDGLPPACSPQPGLAADQLLPRDMNSNFSQLAPTGEGALAGVNLLQAGYHNGIDTISSALRNANLQLRSEPPNPTSKVSPWNNTTIQPDLMRVPLEIGCGPQ